jgi:prephenate dehydrogenase
MLINIIGIEGNFGSFLWNEFERITGKDRVELYEHAFYQILAVPFEAYKEICSSDRMKNKCIINVCSIQSSSNELCRRSVSEGIAEDYLGIHPMFGRRSTNIKDDRYSIITSPITEKNREIRDLFKYLSSITYLDEISHDKYMAKTHVKVLEVANHVKHLLEETEDIPYYCMPPSFLKLVDFAKQLLDMPEGTKDSILANPFRVDKL